jgi:hypothetical protein
VLPLIYLTIPQKSNLPLRNINTPPHSHLLFSCANTHINVIARDLPNTLAMRTRCPYLYFYIITGLLPEAPCYARTVSKCLQRNNSRYLVKILKITIIGKNCINYVIFGQFFGKIYYILTYFGYFHPLFSIPFLSIIMRD